MAFNRPSLATLMARVQYDVIGLNGNTAKLRYTVESILVTALAGLAHGLYGYIDKAVAQIFPDTADSSYMRKWAQFFGITPVAATPATSTNVAITGTGTSLCPAGTLWQRDDGISYSQNASVNIAGGSATIAVTCTTSGLNTNADAGTLLSIVSPVTGINSSALMMVPAVGGGDAESDDSVLARLLQRLQLPPMGGGPGNYVAWALEVPGVTRAWEYPRMNGAGTVGVMFVRDGDGSGNLILPSGPEVTQVANYLATVAPIDTVVTVLAPAEYDVNIIFASLSPNTTDTRNAITSALTDYLSRAGAPGVTLPLSQISETISEASGVVSFTLTAPTADVVVPPTTMPILAVTFP